MTVIFLSAVNDFFMKLQCYIFIYCKALLMIIILKLCSIKINICICICKIVYENRLDEFDTGHISDYTISAKGKYISQHGGLLT